MFQMEQERKATEDAERFKSTVLTRLAESNMTLLHLSIMMVPFHSDQPPQIQHEQNHHFGTRQHPHDNAFLPCCCIIIHANGTGRSRCGHGAAAAAIGEAGI